MKIMSCIKQRWKENVMYETVFQLCMSWHLGPIVPEQEGSIKTQHLNDLVD